MLALCPIHFSQESARMEVVFASPRRSLDQFFDRPNRVTQPARHRRLVSVLLAIFLGPQSAFAGYGFVPAYRTLRFPQRKNTSAESTRKRWPILRRRCD